MRRAPARFRHRSSRRRRGALPRRGRAGRDRRQGRARAESRARSPRCARQSRPRRGRAETHALPSRRRSARGGGATGCGRKALDPHSSRMRAPSIGPVRALSCLPWRSTGRRSPQEFLPSGLGSFRLRRLFAARSTSPPISCSRRSASPAASAPAPTGCCAATAGPESISSFLRSAQGSACRCLTIPASRTFGRGNRRSASLRPGAGGGALFLDHARPDPELQIWGSP